jgi:hypothetical protein
MRLRAAIAPSSASLAVAAVAIAVATLPAEALGHPKRRAGLWEVRSAGSDSLGMPPTRFCVGEATDTAAGHLDRSSGPRGSCSLGQFVRAGEAWVAESVCREGRSTVVSRAVATGDFETEYRIDTVVTHAAAGAAPGAPPRREDREAVVARWLGPCETGQRPGDLVIPGMGTLNMDDGSFRAEAPTRARRPAASGKPPAASPVPPSSAAAPPPAAATLPAATSPR